MRDRALRRFTRREFLKAAATSSALAAASSPLAAWGRGPNRRADFDVAIVGAGSAGISAARTLTGSGRTFVVLEARDHIGGRCHCDNTSFPGIAFDLGGQWLIEVAPVIDGSGRTNNPLYDLALEMGYAPTVDDNPRLLYAPGRPPVSILETPVIDTFVDMTASTLEVGVAASLDPSLDQSVAVATASDAGKPFYDFCAGFLDTAHGSSIERLGCLDVLNSGLAGGEPLIVPSETNYLIESGYGNFLATFAAGMPIHLDTPVTRITWGGGAGVALTTAAGTVTARTAIVTIPIGTLASGLVAFNPVLPMAYQNALAQLPMGYDTKIGLLYDSDVFDVPQGNTFAFRFVDQRLTPILQAKAWGKNYAVFILGGPTVPEMEARGELLDYALTQVNAMFPRATRARLVTAVSSGWNTDPYSLGSFTYAVPGGASGRVTLGTPLAGQLFFAGEAVPVDAHSSVHGAWISGQTAATQILAIL